MFNTLASAESKLECKPIVYVNTQAYKKKGRHNVSMFSLVFQWNPVTDLITNWNVLSTKTSSLTHWAEQHTWVFIPVSACLVEGSDLLIEGSSFDQKSIRRIFIYLEGWYPSRSIRNIRRLILRAIRRILYEILRRQSNPSTRTITSKLSKCLAKSNQEDGWLGQTYKDIYNKQYKRRN